MLRPTIVPFLVCCMLVGGTPSGAVAPQSPDHLPVQAQQAAIPVSADAITMRVRVLRQRRHSDTVDVVFSLEIVGAPAGKSYQVFMQDMGMQQSGLPPVPLPDPATRFQVDQSGALSPAIPSFNVAGFTRGEWVQFTLRSTDGAISKTVRYTPLK